VYDSTNTKQEEEINEALALRYHNDIFQKGKLEVADEILSPDFVLHNPLLPEEFKMTIPLTRVILAWLYA
jgi:predicted SnoaL-like aldol condensation-catalyzing enzyme